MNEHGGTPQSCHPPQSAFDRYKVDREGSEKVPACAYPPRRRYATTFFSRSLPLSILPFLPTGLAPAPSRVPIAPRRCANPRTLLASSALSV